MKVITETVKRLSGRNLWQNLPWTCHVFGRPPAIAAIRGVAEIVSVEPILLEKLGLFGALIADSLSILREVDRDDAAKARSTGGAVLRVLAGPPCPKRSPVEVD